MMTNDKQKALINVKKSDIVKPKIFQVEIMICDCQAVLHFGTVCKFNE
jgi:hypothetical protein